jgi:hypothetical protein
MTTPTTTDTAGWRDAAACARPGVDAEVFFPLDERPDSAGVAIARRVCAGCPVRPECLAAVMAVEDPGERWGVVGGLAPAERTDRWAREHRPAPAVDPAPVVPAAAPDRRVLVVGVQLGLWERFEGSAA